MVLLPPIIRLLIRGIMQIRSAIFRSRKSCNSFRFQPIPGLSGLAVTLDTLSSDLSHGAPSNPPQRISGKEFGMRNEGDVLEVLKFELRFLESGGYQRSPDTPWRAPLIFEYSPTCKTYYRERGPQPCGECPLIQFVPSELRATKVACRWIPLNAEGDTLDSLYRWAYEPEIEQRMRQWLVSTIEGQGSL